jgi:hypothetical protein
MSLSSIQVLMKGERIHRRTAIEAGRALKLSDPIPYESLQPEAKAAWDDFALFQRRYLGRVPIPWQVEAAEQAVELLASPGESFLVVNAPPGAGKSILWHDIACWLTVRDRAVRGQIGSATGPLASRYLRRIRTTLEQTIPVKAKVQDLRSGAAFDALATLAGDYGRFRPAERDLWTNEAFIVVQHGGVAVTEKEATWQSYGIDSGFIGGRFDLILWDDLVDPKRHRSEEARRQLEGDWDDLAETRLEPDGLLVLQGQRLYADDLYRYALNKIEPAYVDEDTGEEVPAHPKYEHIKFPAHFLDRCSEGSHKVGAPAYPEGCLLSPRRLSYRKLVGLQATSPNFEVVYQQEDVDPTNVLVPRAWIYGEDGHIGCLDNDRSLLEVPGHGQMSGFVSILSVDPSPTKSWGITWWLVHPESEQWFLMNLYNRRMEAPDFLGYNINDKVFYGLADEWVNDSKALGVPITHVIFEINAAQRFFMQYDFWQVWCRKQRIITIQHTTSRNKSDPEYGVETIAPLFEFGHIRLPMKGNQSRFRSLDLIGEVTKYDGDPPDDLVMSIWFAVFQFKNLYRAPGPAKKAWRPGWVAGDKTKEAAGRKSLFAAATAGYAEMIRSASGGAL